MRNMLNANSKTWNADDYLEGYCNLGLKDYLVYKDFKNKYKIGHNECMALLAGSHTIGNKNKIFYSGHFKVTHLFEAEDIMDKILMIEPYYNAKGIRRRTFIYTMVILMQNENFEFTEFLQKLKIQPTALQDCNTVDQYKLLIEEIYNYKRSRKINLRF